MRPWRLAAGPAIVLAACSAYTATSPGGPGDPDAGNDAPVPPSGDATSGDDASEGGPHEAGDSDASSSDGGLVANGSFEMKGSNCGPAWRLTGGTTGELVSVAHSGAQSCRLCNVSNPNGFFGAIYDVPPDTWNAAKYTLSGWVRDDTDGGVVTGTLAITQMSVRQDDGGTYRYPGSNATLGIGWQLSSTSDTVAVGESVVGFAIGANSPVGECILVDDVSVVASP
jgi:hypothetical protein